MATWIRGATKNQIADALSKTVDMDDWGLHPETVAWLKRKFGEWEVDRFADHLNTKAPRFNSLQRCSGTEDFGTFSR